jgi:hypothetical protein
MKKMIKSKHKLQSKIEFKTLEKGNFQELRQTINVQSI